jgi:hypothetical protein
MLFACYGRIKQVGGNGTRERGGERYPMRTASRHFERLVGGWGDVTFRYVRGVAMMFPDFFFFCKFRTCILGAY